MEFTIKHLRLFSGEEIEIRHTTDGQSVCPVCGYLAKGNPPYRESLQTNSAEPATEPKGSPSFDICPSCKTQYGEDDFVDSTENLSTKQRWNILRLQWLECIGRNPMALERLRQNLGIDPEKM